MSADNNFQESQSDSTVKQANPLKSYLPVIVVVLAAIVSVLLYKFVFGAPANFMDNNPENLPKDGNILGTIYKGGVIIPIGFTAMIMWITFGIERMLSLIAASGKGSIDVFVQKVRTSIHKGNIEEAMDECDRHKSSVSNVIKSGLTKYRELEKDKSMTMDQKKAALEAEIEEATSLEIPSLQKNLPILATIVSVGVLVGLLGTVIGMIRAFSAMSNAGAPDAGELATGISEALMNTAIGIFNSLGALILYNLFSSIIDSMTYTMDEAKYSIVQAFTSKNK